MRQQRIHHAQFKHVRATCGRLYKQPNDFTGRWHIRLKTVASWNTVNCKQCLAYRKRHGYAS